MNQPAHPPAPPQWRARRLERLLPWDKGPVRPAELLHRLEDILLDHHLLVEDANYHRYAPNHYIVELNPEVYERAFAPIEHQVTRQWQEQLQERLATANSRQGKLVYRLVGPLLIELRGSPALAANEARFLFRLDREAGKPKTLPVALELASDGRRFPLSEGILTIGRDPSNDIPLDDPKVQAARLVSSYHAHLRCEPGRVVLFDGEPGGAPSVNGTFVNGQRLGAQGRQLHEGDVIILAALNPSHPDPNTPGVAVLVFKESK
jgi:hypothetical protein